MPSKYSIVSSLCECFSNSQFCSDVGRLLFMTYNGWVMLAVAVGAFVGYLTFGRNVSSTKTVACH